MPDRTPTEVYAELGALGLRPLDDADLIEIVHRIIAVNEAVEESGGLKTAQENGGASVEARRN